MWPIAACSVIAAAIVVERGWTLRRSRIMPDKLVTGIWQLYRQGQLTDERIDEIREASPLGRMLAAGLANRNHSREVMKEAIGDAGRHVVAQLGRYLNTLGTIASVAPLLGLLGTVFGMIHIFGVIMNAGTGNAGLLAGGISTALLTTAAGLSVAIPTLLFHRFLESKVDRIALDMEEQALRLVEVLKGERADREEAQ
jgi:biopolymer transport protein ExbB